MTRKKASSSDMTSVASYPRKTKSSLEDIENELTEEIRVGKPLRRTYQTDNGLTMVQSNLLNWRCESVYSDKTGERYYLIYVGNIAEGHNCIVNEAEDILTIAFAKYSSEDPALKFKINSLEDAGNIVQKFADGMNINLEGTIYKNFK